MGMPIKSEDGLGSAFPWGVTLLRLKVVCFQRKPGKQAEHGEGVRVNADGAAPHPFVQSCQLTAAITQSAVVTHIYSHFLLVVIMPQDPLKHSCYSLLMPQKPGYT